MSFIDKLFPRKGQDTEEEKAVSIAEEKAGKDKAKGKPVEDDFGLREFDLKHPIKSMRVHMRLVKEGIYKGDKRAWHQFLMVLMISLAGFCAIATLCINLCFDLVTLRYQLSDEHMAKIIQKSKSDILVQPSLPPGEYGMVNIFQSIAFSEDKDSVDGKVVVLVASCKGGATMVATVPDGVEVPKEWLGADSYNLVVDEEGKWTFQQSAAFEKRKETVEKAQREYFERMKAGQPSNPEANPNP